MRPVFHQCVILSSHVLMSSLLYDLPSVVCLPCNDPSCVSATVLLPHLSQSVVISPSLCLSVVRLNCSTLSFKGNISPAGLSAETCLCVCLCLCVCVCVCVYVCAFGVCLSVYVFECV